MKRLEFKITAQIPKGFTLILTNNAESQWQQIHKTLVCGQKAQVMLSST